MGGGTCKQCSHQYVRRNNIFHFGMGFLRFCISAATSSYITLPPPYTHLYSAGGPTGEVHDVDASTGGFGQKNQELLFVPADRLAEVDKTRVALVSRTQTVESLTLADRSRREQAHTQ